MSDWKNRSTLVEDSPKADWKSRSTPIPSSDGGSTASDAMTGLESSLPSKTVAGASQGIPDAIQSYLHDHFPSMVGSSPTQTNKALQDQGVTGDIGPTSSSQLYDQTRAEQGAKEDTASKRSPYANFGGQLAGGIGQMALTGPSVLAGAALGTIQGADKTKANYASGGTAEQKKAAIDTLLGTGVGAGGAYVGNKAANFFNPENLAKIASNRAAAALGVKATRNAATDLGQTVLDQGALPMMGGSEAIKDSIDTAKKQIGSEQIGPTLEKIKSGLTSDDGTGATKLASQAMDTFDAFKDTVSNRSDGPSITASVQKDFMPYLQKLTDAGDDVTKLQAMKQGLQQQSENAYKVLANGQKQPTPESQFYMNLATDVKNHIQDLGNSVSEGLGQDLADANASYGNMTEAGKAANKLVDKDAAKTLNGKIFDTSLLGGAMTLLGGAKTGGLSIGAKLASEGITGNPISRLANIATARGANATSKAADTLGTGTEAFQNAASTVGSSLFNNPTTVEAAQKLSPKSSNPPPLIGKPSGSSASTNPVMNTSNTLNTASNQDLQGLSEKLAKVPAAKAASEALSKALQEKNEQAKNAAIFSIMQNPLVRQLLHNDNQG